MFILLLYNIILRAPNIIKSNSKYSTTVTKQFYCENTVMY